MSTGTDHRKFISQFVGELYAILIGIGIANVIFDLEVGLAHWFEIAMAIFVTVIVALYWWDWASYVEDHFVAGPVEFGIDFAGLIVLEFLFVHFHDPVRLAWNFFALGIVDLTWVVHHIRQSPEQTFSLRRFWVGQKLLGLLLYGAGLAAVLAARGASGDVALGAVVMGTAVLVRMLCFRELRRTEVLTFRPAREEDVADIVAINGRYVDADRTDAFLLEILSEKAVQSLLGDRPARLFVALRGAAVVAYAKVSETIDDAILQSLVWLDPWLAHEVRRGPLLYVEQVAVDPRGAGKGVGKRFYEWLARARPAALPCAFVALRPRCNAGSLRFHAALGFEKAGLFRPGDFLGQQGYESLLLVRPFRPPKALPGWEGDDGGGNAASADARATAGTEPDERDPGPGEGRG